MKNIEYPIRGELYSVERLEEFAAYLADQLKVSCSPKITRPLLSRMRDNRIELFTCYRALIVAFHHRDFISPAGEWLADNFHIVEDQLREIQEDLPPAFYKELPKIVGGELVGYPRVYAMALALLAHTDSQLELETMRRFVQSYQNVSPLQIGELWALSITIRLSLVENLRRIAVRILNDHKQRKLANTFSDQLFEAVGENRKIKKLIAKLPSLCGEDFNEGAAFISQVAKRLRDQEPELWPALESLEKILKEKNSSVEQIVHFLHQSQAANQVTVANIITSMRLISHVNWQDFFESTSLVDRVLESDPIYENMDFLTRDRYRHVIEKISKKSGQTEIAIAKTVVQIAAQYETEAQLDLKRAHVGYYLIDKGLEQIEKQINCKISSFNFALSYPNLIYFGMIGFILSIIGAGPIYYAAMHGASMFMLVYCVLLTLIPCTDLALNLSNLILTNVIMPKNLPKMDLSKGIPEQARTMVVIPCLLSGELTIQNLLEKIEIHYIGNEDPQLFFALLTDFTDGSQESLPQDDLYLQKTIDGINRLNQKYSIPNDNRFFLFHRKRNWNGSENTWMGWERKRGKINEFNRLLRGETNTTFSVITASSNLLSTIKYVITLDADTQLPRDCAQKLIGTITHPLNHAYFDKNLGRVTEGYGIIQPRIGISLESSSRSWFAKIFSGYTGIDPYTTAVSEVYQDLFHEGSYIGKGIYNVDAFEASLKGRIPENTVLSHDLLEGLYARTALLAEVELLDDYPKHYYTFFTRQHRWIRGDWQIAGWIFRYVKNEKGKWTRNNLSLISRWKILDNLRRSLVPFFTMLWFASAWLILPGSSGFWLGYVVFIIIFPQLLRSILEEALLFTTNLSRKHYFARIKPKISIVQPLLYVVFLAHQSYIQIDAIVRVFYRKIVSKKNLLRWATAAQVENQDLTTKRPIWQTSFPIQTILILEAISIYAIHPSQKNIAFSMIALWMCYPLVAKIMSRKLPRYKSKLDANDQLLLRQIARRTWHYFESFANVENNWLPPDNHQVSPASMTAHRTSPTNIGLYILSLLSARDFGYVHASEFLNRIEWMLLAMQKLERHEGHYLNWYDTKTLESLSPKYVSTVDSGNLAGYLLVGRQACLEVQNWLAVDPKFFEGIRDMLSIIAFDMKESGLTSKKILENLSECQKILSQPISNHHSDLASLLKRLIQSIEHLKHHIFSSRERDFLSIKILRQIDSCLVHLRTTLDEIYFIAPWALDHFEDLKMQLSKVETLKSLDTNRPLSSLVPFYDDAILEISQLMTHEEFYSLNLQMDQLIKAITEAKMKIKSMLAQARSSAEAMDQIFKAMNFNFLIDKKRMVFSIGFNVTDGKFDSGLYDLLGSESRLASFIAIAKGDVPQEHWFRLGRLLIPTSEGQALVSWTASMFEYLMPMLVLHDYENTLLSETAQTVVSKQMSYARKHHVPWGISEAGYNARDLQLNYQYSPFGLPGLGLKRGLSHDLVISPYSTFLAAMVYPRAAIKNVKHLISNHLLTEYGFYESVDYTPDRLPPNQKFAVIQSFMAHHQGMTLAAINNVIHDNKIQNRFHKDPRVRATQLLLQERIPQNIITYPPKTTGIEIEEKPEVATNSFVQHYDDPNISSPRVQLLSNRAYSVMISSAGGNYSKCQNLAVTRWKEDSTRDNWGSFIYVKNLDEDKVWSTTYQPLAELPKSYKVTFAEDKVEFYRRDGNISTHTQILVSPEDNIEIRYVTLTNHSGESKMVELTSYLEPVLSPTANDLDHMAFSKLFIQTEFLSTKNALIAKRRKRSPHDKEHWAVHVVVTDGEVISKVQHETDREKFIGRGRSLQNPVCMQHEKLSNTSGVSLDPILSLRICVSLPAYTKINIAFTTGMANSYEQALGFADRYHDIHAFERESKLAWTKSQIDMRHLNIDSESAYLYQRIAERILYSEPSLRPPSHQRAANTNMQSSLWPSGISGDLPIVVVHIGHQKDLPIIRKLLRCHEYLRLKGLVYDFVIINEHPTTYLQDLQDDLQQQIRISGSQEWFGRSGGIYILRADITPIKDLAHIDSVARVSFSSDEPLKDQINRKPIAEKYPEPLPVPFIIQKSKEKIEINLLSIVQELLFFNGIGGFSKNGNEYVIVLGPGEWTPAPWINVIGNAQGFGFQISEIGSGYTWSVNSRTNRLTPWSNDPVSDPSGEIIYLRDDESGEIWTSTPLPIRTDTTYVIKHGQGYSTFEHISHGIHHKLTVFVAKNDTVKISYLTLKNLTERKRKITISNYTEWVLGSDREKTAPFLICDVDQETKAIFARNPHDNEFATKISFSDMSCMDRTFTCLRKEFLGRHGNYADPAALKRDGLSEKRGTGQDPCAVLQTTIELEVGEEKELCILLGQSETVETARELALKYRNLRTVRKELKSVIESWSEFKNTIQIQTPDDAMNILMNHWLLYQTLSSRFWSRTAFYQSGGAYGFRDQLQDCMAFVYSDRYLTREHILRACEHQFVEGDVQHWWHPPTGRGVRTHISDDLLWLPYVVSFYVRVTGDKTILSEKTSFLHADLLKLEQEDSYTLPGRSQETASVLEHCIRAINISLKTGEHGLPLMGTGDWNDGMNRVGALGKGESIWLGWFLHSVITDFLPFCDQPERKETRELYKTHIEKLKISLEESGWDGEWYRRAYFDNGAALGSAANTECKIDSVSQSWSVLSGAGDEIRSKQAMQNVSEFLIQKKSRLILLLTPPFDKSANDPGYIQGYVPGVRENGGQYTHAAIWVMMAFAKLGDGNKTYELFKMLNPILRTANESEFGKYKIEPYVIAADVYGGDFHEGRGGWSWYTGSASWYYRACLESILGFQLRGNKLTLVPCLPDHWKTYKITYKYGNSNYTIQLRNPKSLNTGVIEFEMDGLTGMTEVNLVDDGKNHTVIATMNANEL